MLLPVPATLAPLKNPATPRSANPASILWYPNESHTELAIGDRIYQSFSGYSYKRTLAESIRAAQNGGSGFYRFALTLSDDELAKLKSHVEANDSRDSQELCVHGASRAVTRATGFPIPFPCNISPLWNGALLSAAYYSGLTRVTGLEHHGKRALPGVGAACEAAASAAVLAGAALAGYFGYHLLSFCAAS